MEHDIYELPDVQITEDEEQAFDTAETLITYLMVYGAKLSRDTLLLHLRQLGVTEPQEPALLDTAQRNGILTEADDADQPTAPRIQAVGLLLMERLEDLGIRVLEKDKKTLRLLFGLEDGIPHSREETARIMDITPERVRQIEELVCYRLTRIAIRQRHRQRLMEFYRR